MTPAEFTFEVVIPTVEDFRADRTSRRWAYLSAIAVYHLRDHLAEAHTADTGDPKVDRRAVEAAAGRVDDAVRAALPSPLLFDAVRAVANGSKHALTRSLRGVTFAAGDDETWIGGPMGMTLSFDWGEGGREIEHAGMRIDLYDAVATTLSAFLTALPADLVGCTFAPYPDGR